MQKQLTITLDEAVYDALHRAVGADRISQFIEGLVRPHVVEADFYAGYAEMAAYHAREADADEWSDSLIADGAEERAVSPRGDEQRKE